MSARPLLGAVEAGGTKIVCAVGTGPGAVHARRVIPTGRPQETLAQVIAFFEEQQARAAPVEVLGVGSFGPLDLAPGSPSRGRITSTPKPGWADIDLTGTLGRALDVPIVLDTDVNAAAYGEHRWGAGQGLDSLVYLTVGTGVGGGAAFGGRTITGRMHPEMGHIAMRRHPDDAFAGVCPFHGDCAEGMMSGPALRARYGRPGEDLGDRTGEAVALTSYYLSQVVAAVMYLVAPHRIVLGGGVLGLPGLLERVCVDTSERIGGALQQFGVDSLSGYLTRPALGQDAGVLGALALASLATSPGGAPDWLAAWPAPSPPVTVPHTSSVATVPLGSPT